MTAEDSIPWKLELSSIEGIDKITTTTDDSALVTIGKKDIDSTILETFYFKEPGTQEIIITAQVPWMCVAIK